MDDLLEPTDKKLEEVSENDVPQWSPVPITSTGWKCFPFFWRFMVHWWDPLISSCEKVAEHRREEETTSLLMAAVVTEEDILNEISNKEDKWPSSDKKGYTLVPSNPSLDSEALLELLEIDDSFNPQNPFTESIPKNPKQD